MEAQDDDMEALLLEDDFSAALEAEAPEAAAAEPAPVAAAGRRIPRVLRPGDAQYEEADRAAQEARNMKRAAPADDDGRKRASAFRDTNALAASLRGEKLE